MQTWVQKMWANIEAMFVNSKPELIKKTTSFFLSAIVDPFAQAVIDSTKAENMPDGLKEFAPVVQAKEIAYKKMIDAHFEEVINNFFTKGVLPPAVVEPGPGLVIPSSGSSPAA